MGYAVVAAYAEQYLYDTVAYHHIFGFDRHGDEHQKQRTVRKQHAESKKDAVDGPGCTDGHHVVKIETLPL